MTDRCHVAIKDILHARATDFVEQTDGDEVCCIEVIQNDPQNIDWD